MPVVDATPLLEALNRHPRREALAELCRQVALSAGAEQRKRFSDGLFELMDEQGIEVDDGTVDGLGGSHNVIKMLQRGKAPTLEGQRLLGLLVGLGVSIRPASDATTAHREVDGLTWLAGHSYLDAVSPLFRLLAPDDAVRYLAAAVDVVRERGAEPGGRAAALVAATILAQSDHEKAHQFRTSLRAEVTDDLILGALSRSVNAPLAIAELAEVAKAESPVQAGPASAETVVQGGKGIDPLAAPPTPLPEAGGTEPSGATAGQEFTVPMIVTPATDGAVPAEAEAGVSAQAPATWNDDQPTTLTGELVRAPSSWWATILWAITGLLFLRYVVRFVGRTLLRYRRPATVAIDSLGVTVDSRTELLGRTLRKRSSLIPLGQLVVAAREERYPRAGLYAGIIALSLGTYIGMSLVTDGARAGSPSLLVIGAIVVGLGALCDFVFSSLIPSRAGRTHLMLRPQRGATVALQTADKFQSTEALERLAHLAALATSEVNRPTTDAN